jgi:5-methylthioribose kinase
MPFTLDANDLPGLAQYLREQRWIAPDEQVKSASKPGEGNMNYTLRIRSSFRSFILKQSRDYVEKYPQIPAPADRAVTEGRFYERIQHHDQLRHLTPELMHLDAEANVIMLEDLGESSDFTSLYQEGNELASADLMALLNFVSILHNEFTTEPEQSPLPNREMRALNAEHVFNYPFLADNGLDLDQITPGLQAVASRYQQDDRLKAAAQQLSEHYLSDGRSLLHGDYYPGSWLKTLEGVRVIDPEFGFFGPPEFEIGVLLAHLYLAEQPQVLIDLVAVEYQRPAGFDQAKLDAYTGIEIMRRLIGLAQLPLSLGLPRKQALLEMAYKKLVKDSGQ